ncbi:DUF5343 domain-containing protein [Gimesia maris]|uniref:DUF5343 domain-containing protein n=1 Tax=Gimesia maris TaxID=122 RepID=UPI0032EDDCBF
MGKKKTTKATDDVSSTRAPAFTYTTSPASLRRILQAIPDKPIPETVNQATYKSWGIGNNNATNATRVLKAIGLVDSSSKPTETYAQFMQNVTGPAILGQKIKEHYSQLFNASHAPYRDNDQDLRRLFNIHSGGGESTLKAQVQTFKALCESATFDGVDSLHTGNGTPQIDSANLEFRTGHNSQLAHPTINIDLHIHLPENKSSRDYQAIIEDIAKYIYRYQDDTDV